MSLLSKAKVIKMSEYIIEENLDDIGYDNDLLAETWQAWSIKKRISWISLKLKSLDRRCPEYRTINHKLGENCCKTRTW